MIWRISSSSGKVTKTFYEKRVIALGIRHNDMAEILSGLQEGEAVVTEGAYQLKNINFTTTGGEEEEE